MTSGPSHSEPPRLDLAGAGRLLSALDAPVQVDPDWAVRDAPHALRDAPQIDGYVIEAQLGEGASGRVFRARRIGSEALVAVKVLHHRASAAWSAPVGESESDRSGVRGDRGDPASPRAGSHADRAWRELDLLAQLRLTCVPRLIDFGVIDGRVYMVTEFVEGRRLDEWARARDAAGAPDLRERVRLLADLADAVQSLHEHGVIHRDIKPSNVLVNIHHQPVVIDLGIASLLARDTLETLTAEGAPIGSPAFMAPEQARGERAKTSTRTDVYALAATALFTLTGRTPHDLEASTIHDAIRRVGTLPPRPTRDIDPSLPRPLSAVLDKALSPRPEDRYPSAAALAADLRRYLRSEPVEAAPPSLLRRTTRRLARHPIATTAAVCALMVLATGIATRVAVNVVNERPHEIRFTDQTFTQASLVTVGGRPLKTWTSTDAYSRVFAQLVDRPPEWGGGRVVVTRHFQGSDFFNRAQVQMLVWDVHRLDEPLWTTRSDIPIPDLVPQDWRRDERNFAASAVIVADIFPQSPGSEIVVAHDPPGAPSAIRIYNLKGDTLYECWHRGSMGPLVWNPTDRLLYAIANNNFHSHRRSSTAKPGDILYSRPFFALAPDFGGKHGLINGSDVPPRSKPVWCRYLKPDELVPGLLFAPGGRIEMGRREGSGVIVHFSQPDIGGGGAQLEIDRSGRIVNRTASDSFRVHFGDDLLLQIALSDDPPDGPEAPRGELDQQ